MGYDEDTQARAARRKKRKRRQRTMGVMILLFLILVIAGVGYYIVFGNSKVNPELIKNSLGTAGNAVSGLLTQPMYIVIDVISTVKVWLAYYAIVMTNWQRHVYDELIQLMAKWGRLLVWIMLFFMVFSQVVDIGMTASARYGIRSFQFVYNVPGNFSKMFYFLIPLLTADLCYKWTTRSMMRLRLVSTM